MTRVTISNLYFLFLSAPNFAKRKRMEQAEDSSPDPFLPAHFRISPRHTARILGGQNPERNVLSIFSKNRSCANPKSKEHFSLGLPSGARRRRRGFHWLGIFNKVSSSEIVKTLQKNFRKI